MCCHGTCKGQQSDTCTTETGLNIDSTAPQEFWFERGSPWNECAELWPFIDGLTDF
jgi:hypothetical protein